MTKHMRPQCSQCMYWMADVPPTTGHCHRFPPEVYFNSVSGVAAQKSPLVDHLHWCGEWRDDDDWLADTAHRSIERSARAD